MSPLIWGGGGGGERCLEKPITVTATQQKLTSLSATTLHSCAIEAFSFPTQGSHKLHFNLSLLGGSQMWGLWQD